MMMPDILVDTSVWVDHFRHGNPLLEKYLTTDRVLVHPLIVGEMACGTPPQRHTTLAALGQLRQSREVSVTETMRFIEKHQLYGRGCGLVDIMLLLSALSTPDTFLWTADKRLHALAMQFAVASPES